MVSLERMRKLKNKVPGQKMDILRARAKATKVTPGQLDGMPHGTNVGNPVLEGVILIDEVMEAYAEVIAELEEMKQELTPYICKIEDIDQRAFIRLFYIDMYTIPAIADSVTASGRQISERQVQRILHNGESVLVSITPNIVMEEKNLKKSKLPIDF